MDVTVASVTAGINWFVIFAIAAGIIVALVLIGMGITALKRLLTRPEMLGLSREEIARRWVQIIITAKQGSMGAKVAVMEADTLLDSALKSMNMPGMTLGERLKAACYKYPKLQQVWWAHKLRNQLVHEASFNLSPRQALSALDEYERALKTLNVV